MEKDPFLSYIYTQVKNSSNRASSRVIERANLILNLIHAPKLSLYSLQAICFHGIPDEYRSLRPLCWKILLGYLPERTYTWQKELDNCRKNYKQYIEDYYVPFKAAFQVSEIKKKAERVAKMSKYKQANGEENKQPEPLSPEPIIAPESEKLIYPGFKEDDNLWDNIVKDTKRTRSEMDFFQRVVSPKLDSDPSAKSGETHDDVLARILFIYAKLNPAASYVQGMNEVVAPIYYCFCGDQNPAFEGHAEADTFFCFLQLMGELNTMFIKHLDNTEVGIQARIMELNKLLKHIDREVWEHLERYKVNPQFYSLRWLMLLLTQEFEITEVIRMWDALLSHPEKLVFLNYLCIAMILGIRERLLRTDDFADLVEMLQKETAKDLGEILARAGELFTEYGDPEKKVYHIAFGEGRKSDNK